MGKKGYFLNQRKQYYYNSLYKLFGQFIPQGSKVLEVSSEPGKFSKGIKIAKKESYATNKLPRPSKKNIYPYILLPDLINHVDDIQPFLEKLRMYSANQSQVIITGLHPFWEPVMSYAERLGLKSAEPSRNWVPLEDLENLAYISGYSIVKRGTALLIPVNIPLISPVVNWLFPHIPLLNRFGWVQYVVASLDKKKINKGLGCSIVIPCFNEEDNIETCIKKAPKIGRFTEIMIVDDGSTDKTVEKVKGLMKQYKNVRLIAYKPNKGKGYAVKRGFDAAKGDIIMIWDADRTVPESELVRFHEALASGRAEFANGTRLIYPMEDQAMRWLNLLGNRMFSLIYSWILNTHISDTLCGTKALFKKDYKKIKMGGEPWGDFDLLFGAAKLGLKIIEVPVHYRKRVAGKSKMKAFKHGMVLLKMSLIGALKLKILKNY